MSTTELNNAVAAALAAAQTSAPSPGYAPVAGEVMPAITAGRLISLLDKINNASANCEFYFKTYNPAGMILGNEEDTFFDTLEVTACLNDFKPCYVVKYWSAKGPKYIKSYDRERDAGSNRSWADVLTEVKLGNPTFDGRDYPATEMVVTLAKDYETKSGAKFPAGTRIRCTTSQTGDKPVTTWLTEMVGQVRAGKIDLDTALNIKLTHKTRAQGSTKWGVFVPTTTGLAKI